MGAREEDDAALAGGGPKRAEGIVVQPFSSSSRRETFLVWLPSGRALEVSKGLADMLVLMDGRKSIAEIAEILSASGPGKIQANEVEKVIEQRLVPAGLVLPDPRAALAKEGPVEHRPRESRGIVLFSARSLRPLTLRLQVLFSQRVRAPLIVLAFLCAWVLLGELFVAGRGYGPAHLTGRETAGLYGLLLVSVLFHELGHLSALRFHGGEHGEVRMGVYIVFPVLYANVTRAWGLSRKARIDVDLGGVYFQLLLSIPCLAAYWVSSSPVWPSLAAGILSMAALAMNPFFRFDGYWLCSDLLGVPNLRERSRRHLRQVWVRLRREGMKEAMEDAHLGRTEAIGLLLYGILSHAFFLAAGFVLVRFFFLRPDPFATILVRGPMQVLESLRSGHFWQGVALLPVTAAGYAAAYGMFRLVWQGVRLCVRTMTTRMGTRSGGVSSRALVASGRRRFRHRVLPLLVVSLLGWGASACDGTGIEESGAGSGEESPGAGAAEEGVSSEPLERNQEGATGGNFVCLFCTRSWQWEVPADSGALVLYVAYSVEDASEDGFLRFLRQDGSVLWERRIVKGEQGSVCLTDDDPRAGLYELSLTGGGPFGFVGFFRGSIWARVGSERIGFLDSLGRDAVRSGPGPGWTGMF